MSTSKIAAIAAAQSLVALPYAKEFSHIYFEILGLIVDQSATGIVIPATVAPATAVTATASPVVVSTGDDKKKAHANRMQNYRKNKKKADAKAAKAATVVAVA